MHANLVGWTLGQYEIVQLVGEGAMGRVYRAYQPSLDRHVAIKVLAAHNSGDADFSERFRREARAIARLEHPNILPIFDFGDHEVGPYIVTPFVPGGTVRAYVGRPQPGAWVAAICGQIAEALDYAHSRRVLHRDVKPANVLLGPDDRLLLADFGLAKLLGERGDITAERVAMGTPEYMSPEQCLGQDLDGRADLYALASIVFELLTGSVPYRGPSILQVVHRQVHAPVPSLQALNVAIPGEVDHVVRRALSKDREERFGSCVEFMDHLRHALNGSGPSTATVEYPLVAPPAPGGTSPERGAGLVGMAGAAVPTDGPPQESPAVSPRLDKGATPVAVGVRARDIPLVAQPAPRRRFRSPSRRWWAVAAAGVISATVVAWGATVGHTPKASAPMTGLVNVAIGEFGQVDSGGHVARWDYGARLSQSVYTRLQSELEAIPGLSGVVQVRHEGVGLVQGASQAQRAEAARNLASKLGAQILLYGNVEQRDNQTVFAPEFFVSGLAGAEELAGASYLGTPVATPSASDPLGYLLPLTDTLRARSEALTLFTVGLTYFVVGNPATAVAYLERANAVQPWRDAEGKEVIYLFLGTAYRSRGDPGDLERAQDAYRTAVRLNPEYTRGRIALGNLYYDEFHLAGASDPAKLEESIVEYEQAARTRKKDSALDAKVLVSLGNAYVVMAQTGNPEFFGPARVEFERVVDEFERGNTALDGFASHAYFGLGVVFERAEQDFAQAAAFYRKSMALASGNKELHRLAATQLAIIEQQLSAEADL